MGVGSLKQKELPVANRVMGIDASTKSLAFCIMEDDRAVVWGEIDITGDTIHDKCGDINRKTYALLKKYDVDYVGIEEAIYVNNRKVIIKLAKVFGSIIGVIQATGVKCEAVHPSTWMSYINNPVRNSKELKEQVRKEHPGESKTWYKNKLRQWRKERTQDWVLENLDVDSDNDNVCDSIGVAWYTWNELTRRE